MDKDSSLLKEVRVSRGKWDDYFKEQTYEGGKLVFEREVNSFNMDDPKAFTRTSMHFKNGEESSGFRWAKEDHSDEKYEIVNEKRYKKEDGKLSGEYFEHKYKKIHGSSEGPEEDYKKEGTYWNGYFTGTEKETIRVKDKEGSSYFKTVVNTFENGLRVCTDLFREGGQISSLATNGPCWEQIEGLGSAYYQQVNGKKEGVYEVYSDIEKKHLVLSTNYKNGKLSGFYKSFDKDGNLLEMRYYQGGKDNTKKYSTLKKSAARNVSPKKDEVTPKQSTVDKFLLDVKIKTGLIK